MPDVLHNTLIGVELHYPLGHATAGALPLTEGAAWAYRIQAPRGAGTEVLFEIDTTEPYTVSLSEGGDRTRVLSRYLRIGSDGTTDAGVVTAEGAGPAYGGLIWSNADEEYLLCRLVGVDEPDNLDGRWEDVKSTSSIDYYHGLRVARILLQNSSTPTSKGVYSKSDNRLYFYDGTDELLISHGATRWANESTDVAGSGSGAVLSIAVAEGDIDWVQFHALASDTGVNAGGFSGEIIYKRETGGDVEILHSEVRGSGESTIDLAATANTGSQAIELTGTASAATTTFDVYYLNKGAVDTTPAAGTWTTASTTVTGGSVDNIVVIGVSAGRVGVLRFTGTASDGSSNQGGFSGEVHYKRESGGNVEILHFDVRGAGEDNMAVDIDANTATQEIELEGYAASSDTTFRMRYLIEEDDI